MERLFGRLHADYYTGVASLRDIYHRINGDTLGLRPFVPYSAFSDGKLDHLTFFFQYLASELDELCQ